MHLACRCRPAGLRQPRMRRARARDDQSRKLHDDLEWEVPPGFRHQHPGGASHRRSSTEKLFLGMGNILSMQKDKGEGERMRDISTRPRPWHA